MPSLFCVLVMGGMMMGAPSELQGQERVLPEVPFTADTTGWFFTDAQVAEMARDVEKVQLLEEKVRTLEELNALREWQIEVEKSYRDVYDDLLEEAKDAYSPTFWQRVPAIIYVGAGMGLGIWATK